ncbi:MAG TPA: RsmE family RNA methyltransferase, partial [Anaeromyxobacteraceae bacterium]
MRRLFVPRGRIAGDRAQLAAADVHYLCGVLRLAPGAELEVFDGEGGAYPARLSEEGGALVAVLSARREAPGPRARVHLAFALARGERCDLVVQKATELGVARILPFAAERSVVRLDPAKGAARAARWRRIAEEAARQSGRADVPEVRPPVSLPQALADLPPGTRAFVFHRGGGPLAGGAAATLAAVIGPEGGLTEAEV